MIEGQILMNSRVCNSKWEHKIAPSSSSVFEKSIDEIKKKKQYGFKRHFLSIDQRLNTKICFNCMHFVWGQRRKKKPIDIFNAIGHVSQYRIDWSERVLACTNTHTSQSNPISISYHSWDKVNQSSCPKFNEIADANLRLSPQDQLIPNFEFTFTYE